MILETSGVPFFGPEGELRGFRGIDRNITERKRTELKLREAEETFSLLLKSERPW